MKHGLEGSRAHGHKAIHGILELRLHCTAGAATEWPVTTFGTSWFASRMKTFSDQGALTQPPQSTGDIVPYIFPGLLIDLEKLKVVDPLTSE